MLKSMKKLFLAISMLSTLALATPPEPKDQTLTSLTKLENLWRAKKILNYSFTLERSCFCAPRVVTMTFTVKNGKSQISNLTKGQNIKDWMIYSSIEKSYAQMRILLKKGGRVALVMDTKNAIPNQIIFDRKVNATDDELYITISSFKKL